MKKKDVKWFIYIACLLFSVLLVAALPVSGEEELYDDVLRLHILANSDSENDQALKLTVRDKILSVYGDDLAACTEKEEAEEMLFSLQDDIQRTAKACIEAEGYNYPVTVSLRREDYPTRHYENVTLPSGNYCSLRIIIGEGAGQNWWCVLFPPMCVGSAIGTEDTSVPVGLSEAEYHLISGGGQYRIKFKILEIVESLFS